MKDTLRTDHARHPIRVVAERTGLAPTLLRAWERRYGVVEPGRSDGGQRLYSDDDVERLLLLRTVVDAGRSIGSVADRSDSDLRGLVEDDQKARELRDRVEAPTTTTSTALDEAMAAVEGMDAPRLDRELRRLAITLGAESFIDHILTPLLERIGDRWRAGKLRPAQEHVATAVIKQILGSILERSRTTASGRRIVIGMLAGEPHGLGGLLAATSAALAEWDVLFLGEDLPATEIHAAVEAMPAELVGLSVVSPLERDGVPGQLKELLALLPDSVGIILGGRSSSELASRIGDPRVSSVPSLSRFRKVLREMQG